MGRDPGVLKSSRNRRLSEKGSYVQAEKDRKASTSSGKEHAGSDQSKKRSKDSSTANDQMAPLAKRVRQQQGDTTTTTEMAAANVAMVALPKQNLSLAGRKIISSNSSPSAVEQQSVPEWQEESKKALATGAKGTNGAARNGAESGKNQPKPVTSGGENLELAKQAKPPLGVRGKMTKITVMPVRRHPSIPALTTSDTELSPGPKSLSHASISLVARPVRGRKLGNLGEKNTEPGLPSNVVEQAQVLKARGKAISEAEQQKDKGKEGARKAIVTSNAASEAKLSKGKGDAVKKLEQRRDAGKSGRSSANPVALATGSDASETKTFHRRLKAVEKAEQSGGKGEAGTKANCVVGRRSDELGVLPTCFVARENKVSKGRAKVTEEPEQRRGKGRPCTKESGGKKIADGVSKRATKGSLDANGEALKSKEKAVEKPGKQRNGEKAGTTETNVESSKSRLTGSTAKSDGKALKSEGKAAAENVEKQGRPKQPGTKNTGVEKNKNCAKEAMAKGSIVSESKVAAKARGQAAATPGKVRSKAKAGTKETDAGSECVNAKEFDKLLVRARNQLSRLRQEQHALEVYDADGWRGASREKVRLTDELQRAAEVRTRCFMAIRECIRLCDEAEGLRRIPASKFDAHGEVDQKHIICCVCKRGHSTEENDIILCDGGCYRAFHSQCLEPPLDTSTLDEDKPWLCPGCVVKEEILGLLNDEFDTDYTVDDPWTSICEKTDEHAATNRANSHQHTSTSHPHKTTLPHNTQRPSRSAKGGHQISPRQEVAKEYQIGEVQATARTRGRRVNDTRLGTDACDGLRQPLDRMLHTDTGGGGAATSGAGGIGKNGRPLRSAFTAAATAIQEGRARGMSNGCVMAPGSFLATRFTSDEEDSEYEGGASTDDESAGTSGDHSLVDSGVREGSMDRREGPTETEAGTGKVADVDGGLVLNVKRVRKHVDYRALHAALFGDAAEEESDQEFMPGHKKRRRKP